MPFKCDENFENLIFTNVSWNILFDELNKNLFDKVVDNDEEANSFIFGTGFGGISDIETGPDGFLYVLSFEEGKLYMIFK